MAHGAGEQDYWINKLRSNGYQDYIKYIDIIMADPIKYYEDIPVIETCVSDIVEELVKFGKYIIFQVDPDVNAILLDNLASMDVESILANVIFREKINVIYKNDDPQFSIKFENDKGTLIIRYKTLYFKEISLQTLVSVLRKYYLQDRSVEKLVR